MRLHEITEGLDSNQRRVGQVGAEEQASTVSPVLGKKDKQHPFKGRLVGEDTVQEAAPPGMEDWIKDRKADFKKRYGDRWQEVLYATAWKQKKNEGMAEGMAGMDDAEPYTIGGAVDKQYVYTVKRDGKSMGIYHSLDDAKSIVANNKRTNKYSEFKIMRKPRSKMAGPVGQLPEQGVAEGSIDQRIAQAKKNNPLRASVAKKTNGYTALVTDTITGKPSWFGGAFWQTPELAMGHAKAFVKGFPYLEQEYAQRFVDKNRNGIVEQGVAEANDEKIADRYDQDEWDEKMQRLKKLAGAGPLKTVWDPDKRVYKNVPVNQKPEDK